MLIDLSLLKDQALVLLNDPVYTDAAFAFGRRILSESPDDTDASRIDYGFRIAVSRQPTAREVKLVQKLLNSERQALLANPKKVEAISSISSSFSWVPPRSRMLLLSWCVVSFPPVIGGGGSSSL